MMKDYGFVMDKDVGIQHLDNVIKKAPKRKKIIYAYRGERSEYHAKKLLGMNVGESYSTESFTSASLSASFAYYAFSSYNDAELLSMFIIPPSFPAAYISHDHTEMEILLARGATFTLKEKRVIQNKDRSNRPSINLLVWDVTL